MTNIDVSTWITLVGAPVSLVVVILLCYAIVRYYTNPKESSKLAVFTCSFAFSSAAVLILLIPLDIFLLSDDSVVKITAQETRIAYYSVFAVLLTITLVLCPFAFFYHEEDEWDGFQDISPWKRAKGACKCSSLVTIIMIAAVVCVFVLKLGKFKEEKLLSEFESYEQSFIFLMGCISIAGVVGWLLYTAVGAGMLPVRTLLGNRQLSEDFDTAEETIGLMHQQSEHIRSKYSLRDSGSDRLSLRDQRRLDATENRQKKAIDRHRLMHRSNTCLTRFLARSPIVRYVLALIWLVFTLTFAGSICVTQVDTLLNGSGLKDGFTLDNPKLTEYNPMNQAFQLTCKVGLDSVLLACLVMYIFFSSVYGISMVGILQIYQISPRKTDAQALLLASMIIPFLMIVLMMELTVIVPSYATFGCQSDCDADTCDKSQWGEIAESIREGIPFFGIVYYFTNWGFVGFVLLSSVIALLCKRKEKSADWDDDI